MRPHVPLLTDAEAWRCLPPTRERAAGALPAWARALARTLPATTAAMLELDWRQRDGSPLDPVVRGKMRYVAALANDSLLSLPQIEDDLRRAGVASSELAILRQPSKTWPMDERGRLVFAHKMTKAAHTVIDEEVEELVRVHGEANVVAMVLLLAYANFQDRLVASLGVELEPAPPLQVRFDRAAFEMKPQPRVSPTEAVNEHGSIFEEAEWKELAFADLQRSLSAQKDRPGRVRIPSWAEVERVIRPEVKPPQPLRIQWSLVCHGYQPDLAAGWIGCTRAFGVESEQDRVFEESLFWVVTRSLRCFY